jgi:hypothetical protein
MAEVNYAAMSDAELKRYFRENHSEEAVQVYLDRFSQRPKRVIATADDPDFDSKIAAEIRRRLDAKSTQDGSAMI